MLQNLSSLSNNLLILESGLQLSREYWLKDFINLGYNLYLAQPWPMTWEQPYIKKYLHIRFNPWTQVEQGSLRQFILDNNINGIICLNEGTIPFASDILKMISFPRLTSKDIKSLRNKMQMRKRLSDSEIFQPKYTYLDENTSIDNIDVSFPAVVKPAEMMASLGVKLVKDKAELASAVTAAQNVDFNGENLRQHYGFDKGVLIESYLNGNEFSIETFVQNGDIVDFFITRKFKCAEPYFDEIGHLANPPITSSLKTAIKKFILELHKTLGILNAITHTEVKIDGELVGLIEIGCRPGGDLIPLIHNLSADVSFADVAAKIHTGIKLENYWLPIDKRKEVAVYFPHDRQNFVITKLELDKILKNAKIFQFIFEENSEPINDGLATSRKGQIIFSHESHTENILKLLVSLTGGN